MIIFSSVTKTFGNGNIALDDFSIYIESGELVVLSGPSGSGKTTVMRLLIKEYNPTSGNIIFDDTPLSKIKNRHLPKHRRKIGVIFQDYKLLTDLNVWENIALPLYIIGKKQSEIEERVTDLLRLIGLEEKAWVFPVQLSGGEAQRVSIARALATGPDVIFADEPTGNLDQDSSLIITKLLKKINELGTTVLIATHDTSVLKELEKSRHIFIKKGKLELDTHKKTLPDDKNKKLENKESKKQEKPTEDIKDQEPKTEEVENNKKKDKNKTQKTAPQEEIKTDKEKSSPEKKSDEKEKIEINIEEI